MEQQKTDIYARVTNQIIEAIEAGTKTLRMPWHITDTPCFQPVNVVSKRHYRGVNVLSLWVISHLRQYSSGLWGTYKQWADLGGLLQP